MWKLKNVHAIGGLINLGFHENSDLLLVVSHQGKGLFDCSTGSRVARDHGADHWGDYERKDSSYSGIGGLLGVRIATHGLHGGDRMPKEVTTGARLVRSRGLIRLRESFWNNHTVANLRSVELRAFGFSPTRKTLVVGTSTDITIWVND